MSSTSSEEKGGGGNPSQAEVGETELRRTIFKLSADSLHCRTRAVVASCMCPLRLLQALAMLLRSKGGSLPLGSCTLASLLANAGQDRVHLKLLQDT